MCALFDWIKSASERIFDPRRDERIRAIAHEVEAVLFAEKTRFDFDRTLNSLQVLPEDARPVAERIYTKALGRVYSSTDVSERQKDALSQLAQTLKIDASRSQALKTKFLVGMIRHAIEAISNEGVLGNVDREIIRRTSELAQIAPIQWSNLFPDEISHCTKRAFQRVTAKDSIDESAWQNVLDIRKFFSLPTATFQQTLQEDGRMWADRLLTRLRPPATPSNDQLDTLYWIVANIPLEDGFRRSLDVQLSEFRIIAGLAQGQLPSITCTDVELRAGEIAHAQFGTEFEIVRQRQSGNYTESHRGVGTITDYRFIFVAPARTFTVNHTRIISITPTRDGMELRTSGHGDGRYLLPAQRAHLIVRIFETAMRKAYQTITEQSDDLPTRHIPRDVRQRVWQRYGGRCAECGSDQYLEFDHIIPVARGGSNTDENVQLLCRNCNLSKSDNI